MRSHPITFSHNACMRLQFYSLLHSPYMHLQNCTFNQNPYTNWQSYTLPHILIKKNQLDALILQIYFWNKTLHVSDSSSVHHQYMSYRFAVRKSVWHTPLLCVQWKTPDDGQRNCPKHVVFYSKNKFEKLVHLVGFIIRIYHDARSPEHQTLPHTPYMPLVPWSFSHNLYTHMQLCTFRRRLYTRLRHCTFSHNPYMSFYFCTFNKNPYTRLYFCTFIHNPEDRLHHYAVSRTRYVPLRTSTVSCNQSHLFNFCCISPLTKYIEL